MSEDKKYNGWNNYETWCYALWMNNDEGFYRFVLELADEAKEQAEDTEREPAVILSEMLKSNAEETMPDLGSSCWTDMLNSAFGEIDWYEIAENILSE